MLIRGCHISCCPNFDVTYHITVGTHLANKVDVDSSSLSSDSEKAGSFAHPDN